MFVKRDGIFYDMRLTPHAKQRVSKRKIPFSLLREAIERGKKKVYPQTVQFFYRNIKVVVSTMDFKILTVYPLDRRDKK